jgi:hypothetical protein
MGQLNSTCAALAPTVRDASISAAPTFAGSRSVAAQVAFEKANFETSRSHFIGSRVETHETRHAFKLWVNCIQLAQGPHRMCSLMPCACQLCMDPSRSDP